MHYQYPKREKETQNKREKGIKVHITGAMQVWFAVDGDMLNTAMNWSSLLIGLGWGVGGRQGKTQGFAVAIWDVMNINEAVLREEGWIYHWA